MNVAIRSRPLVIWGLLFFLVCMSHAEEPLPPSANADPLAVGVIPSDGFNLAVEEIISPERVVVKLVNPVHNFFAGKFTNLPTDRDFTLGLSVVGNDTKGNKADVTKWRNLKPLFSYSDPTLYESYEWFAKDDQGRWVSGDIFKAGSAAKYAGIGNVPAQKVIPAELAPQFLSADGKFWCPWQEIETTEAVPSLGIFRMTQKFSLPTASVSFRIPYTYTYLQAFLTRLQVAKLPCVFVDEIGTTPEGRKLQVIRLEDPTNTGTAEEHQTVLIIAQEHSTEPASSWCLQGALNTLLAETPEAQAMRRARTWLFIPIQDPDGSANAVFDRITNVFYRSKNRPIPSEVLAYAQYFSDYVNTGKSIDVTVSLHNVEANECPNTFSPFLDMAFPEQVLKFNSAFFFRLRQLGYKTAPPEQYWNWGCMTFRLYGWIAERFGAFDLCFEVNDRYPSARLSLAQLQGIGAVLAEQLACWTASSEGEQQHQLVCDLLARHRQARHAYLARTWAWESPRTSHELLTLGY